MSIPTALFHFRYTVTNPKGGSFECNRHVKACGYEEAVQKLKEEFIYWNEEVHEFSLMNIQGLQ